MNSLKGTVDSLRITCSLCLVYVLGNQIPLTSVLMDRKETLPTTAGTIRSTITSRAVQPLQPGESPAVRAMIKTNEMMLSK